MENEGLSAQYKDNACAQYVVLNAEEQCAPGKSITMCY